MTITVSAPNNITVEFPDGTAGAVIENVMRQHFGGGAAAQPKASPITTGGLVRAAAEGIPVVGGLLNKANAATYAGLAPLAPGDETVSHAPSFGERYRANLAREEAKSGQFETEHPIASTAAGLAGGVAATAPLAATAAGARLLGVGGQTLRSQIGAGALSGAGIGGVDALVRGNDPTTAGVVGGVIGGAVPPVVRGIGAAAAPVINTMRGIINPGEEAARRVGAAIERDVQAGGAGLTQQEFAAARTGGPVQGQPWTVGPGGAAAPPINLPGGAPVNLMDLGGETTRGLARSAANTSPEGRQVLNQALDDRYQSQSDRLSDWFNSSFNYPNAPAQQQALRESQSAANNVNYARAMREGSGGIWSPELERLASSDIVANAMKKAASVARDESVVGGYAGMNPQVSFTPDGRIQFGRGPTGTPTYPDLQFWDLTRRQLSNSAQMARRAGDMEEARRFGTFAQRLNGELDSHVPSYATARAGHEAFAGAQDALEAGRNYATQSRIDNRGAREALLRMTPQERGLFQDGFADALISRIRSMPDRQNIAAKIANSRTSQEQMEIALGPQRARELQGMLHLENVMNTARQAVQGNSTSVRQFVEMGLAGGANSMLASGNPFSDPTAALHGALMWGALRHGGNAALAGVNERISRQVAQLLASNNPGQVRMGMNMLGRNEGLLGSLRRADVALARSAAVQAQPDQNRRLQ
jgi:hypothetical protein